MTPGQAGGAMRDARHGSATDVLKPGLVSIIIPNFNNAPYLADAIQSALGQTYRDFEVIVVDDGSTDNSREVVAGFGDQVHCIWQENRGLAGARNTGIRAASGEFIGLLDADDQWLPGYLATMVELSRLHPEAAVYYCGARCMDAEGVNLPRTIGAPIAPPDEIFETLLRTNFIVPSTVLLRHAIVLNAGSFDRTLRSCEDWDLWLRIAPKYHFQGLEEPLVRYRLHDASLSADLAGMHRAIRAMIEKNYGQEVGDLTAWPHVKRRAYGGLYRYHALTSVQRAGDWSAGGRYVERALLADPTLAIDIDFFYDLALGSQPAGLRGTPQKMCLADNAVQIDRMLMALASSPTLAGFPALERQVYGTAYFALGLVAYSIGQLGQSRGYLSLAVTKRPDLWCDRRWLGHFARTMIGSRRVLERLRALRHRNTRAS